MTETLSSSIEGRDACVCESFSEEEMAAAAAAGLFTKGVLYTEPEFTEGFWFLAECSAAAVANDDGTLDLLKLKSSRRSGFFEGCLGCRAWLDTVTGDLDKLAGSAGFLTGLGEAFSGETSFCRCLGEFEGVGFLTSGLETLVKGGCVFWLFARNAAEAASCAELIL